MYHCDEMIILPERVHTLIYIYIYIYVNDNMITAPQFALASCVLQVLIQNFTDCF